jgi:hypothetical protein
VPSYSGNEYDGHVRTGLRWVLRLPLEYAYMPVFWFNLRGYRRDLPCCLRRPLLRCPLGDAHKLCG